METLFNKLKGLAAAVASASASRTSQQASSQCHVRVKAPNRCASAPRLQPRMKISRQVVTGSGRSCPTCPRQDSTCYNHQICLPASDGQVRTARASVQSRRTPAGITHVIFSSRLPMWALCWTVIVQRVTMDSTGKSNSLSSASIGLSLTLLLCRSRVRRATHTDQILSTIVFVGVPMQWGASELRFGFADQAVLCQITWKLSLRSWLLQGSGFMVCPSLVSQYTPHTTFARVRPEAFFGSPCAQPSHPLRLLVTKLHLFGDFNARGGSVCSSAIGIHDKEVENRNGAMFRHTLEGCKLVASSTFSSHRYYMDVEPWHGTSH